MVEEKLVGVVERITFHSEETGWSVLRVSPQGRPNEQTTVTVHQGKVFAGATLEFHGVWTNHPKFGEQFKASNVIERKPASASALEKYLGSGLIYGVGPKTAKKIVKHFGEETLEIFEDNIERMTEVPGIAKGKLSKIKESWTEHREIRNVMMFLQEYGVSTLYAVKIFKTYGQKAIEIVSENPYQLSKDIYGIGFFSADRIALSLGFEKDSPKRVEAAVKHVLAASRDEGHCFLTLPQILEAVDKLIAIKDQDLIQSCLVSLEEEKEISVRAIDQHGELVRCFYNKTLFFDEETTASKTLEFIQRTLRVDEQKVWDWLNRFNAQQEFPLSDEQAESVAGVVSQPFSILTGGPGCGKTTTTKAIVRLAQAMGKEVLLAAPTGRAAQRMGEVIGMEAKTIHRLLVFDPVNMGFKKNEEDTLDCDFLIVDECSMLDISLTASLMKAVPKKAQVLFIGDVDQLPSVGAGNVLKDLIESTKVPVYRLTQVFRQAQESKIITFAHNINSGESPKVDSPFHDTKVWEKGIDCLFVDSEEASMEQSQFIRKVSKVMKETAQSGGQVFVKKEEGAKVQYQRLDGDDLSLNQVQEEEVEYSRQSIEPSYLFQIPQKFLRADVSSLLQSNSQADALKAIMKNVHPWSSLRYGMTATEMVVHLYTKTIREKLGANREIQVLSPMTRGSLGTKNLNMLLQAKSNPPSASKPEIRLGDKLFRQGDRVIQRRNNYELEVFNGDIGKILAVDPEEMELLVAFKTKEGVREIAYGREYLNELDLAYAITIHKSQGSEFDVVILPILSQHFTMLYRNLIYTGLTRAKKMALFVGSRKALGLAVRNVDNRARQTYLRELVAEEG